MEEPKRCISDLPNDLLMEIFVRVPCKSAFQCKCISKRWSALISNPDFTCSFLRHYKSIRKCRPKEFDLNFFSKQVLLISRRLPEVDFPLTPSFLPCFQMSQKKACVVGSSKGLLLCCTTRDNKKIYYVCNPLTKHWAVLPPNPSSQELQEVRIGFICHYSYRNPNSRCRYKVVLLTEFLGSKSQIKVETFSSVTGQWTKFVVSCPHNIEINLCGSAIAYEGKLHWFMPSDNKILVYHPVHDKVHAIIDGPEEADPLLGSQCFDLCRDIVRIARVRSVNTPQCSLSMWRLCNNTGKWCLEHQVNLKEFTFKDNSQPPKPVTIKSLRKVNVLALDPDDADIVYLGLSKRIVACNLRTKTFTEALKFGSQPPSKLPRQALRHVLPPWPTPVPALPHDALPRSKRKADRTEVEDGEVRAAEVEVDMATRRIKHAKMMPAAVWE